MANELLKCKSCGNIFKVQDMKDSNSDDSDENSTQFGLLAGACPKCGAEIPLSLSQIRKLLTGETGN
jgi:uncharacterized C2H2 Zn-finger protein